MTSRALAVIALMSGVFGVAHAAAAESKDTVDIRGHAFRLVISGTPGGQPVILSSGDGGWIHLAPHVAEVLASRGLFVVGFDTRAYLEAFTSGHSALSQTDVPGDYRVLVDYVSTLTHRRPLLVGVSEGAGLSVLAATGEQTRGAVSGVLAIGLPNVNELAWRWKDAIIYLTHGAPNEPTFRADEVVRRLSSLPLAVIHSTEDEFAPLTEVEQILGAASEPKKLWKVRASDHRFSDNLDELDRSLLEAVRWTATVRGER